MGAMRKHGHCGVNYKSPTYRSWASMKTRCLNPNDRRFADYGGRGIGIDKRWEVFSEFLADMGVRPDGTTLDRLDGSRGYCKENCRWATPAQQANNRKTFSTSRTGVNGVTSECGGSRFRAYGYVDGKQVTLYFGAVLEEAISARRRFDAAIGGREG